MLDEYYWLNKRRPQLLAHAAPRRSRGQDAHTDKKFGLTDKGRNGDRARCSSPPTRSSTTSASTRYSTTRCSNSNFWLYWRTMFAFENWHTALEMKLYHHSATSTTSAACPTSRRCASRKLQSVRVHDPAHGAVPCRSLRRRASQYGAKVDNVEFDIRERPQGGPPSSYAAERRAGRMSIDLTDNDLVIHHQRRLRRELRSAAARTTPAPFNADHQRGRRLGYVAQNRGAGSRRSAIRTSSAPIRSRANWMSATVTTLDRQDSRRMSRRSASAIPFTGERRDRRHRHRAATPAGSSAGRSTASRSSARSPKGQLVGWIYGLFTDTSRRLS